MRDFRFGFNFFDVPPREDFVARCRTAERLGYDVALVPDHLGGPAPFPTMVAAAEATERLRVGTLVLNVPFWNPHLLAREVATADRLTGGRVELGLGAGHMKWEFEAAGLPWEPFGARTDRLAETIEELGRLFGGPGYEQHAARDAEYGLAELRPVQRRGFDGSGPPLLIGGTGDRVLRLAARHADIIAYAGVYQLKGEPPGTFRIGTAAEAGERVEFVRGLMGERADEAEASILIQAVVVTDDRRAAAERLSAERLPFLTPEEILETPFLLIGTYEQMAGQLVERRERFGFSYITVHGPYMETFGSVIERLR
ncbi:probable F420-dependent oxidoreductase, MSMEG_2516 family [Thermomonospora echinospora]|uniref:Probable F420-dependent oxidoreductase, MSMEG_2516 family n=1 Tax=Thermomonospora echinospora TaxID=1992 RepID=A0A1H5RZ48_9ACTN|nr:LLM class F420-dependent oxidoreductase [Thermomonospora echinospora]SEF43384.1 probable F420-dependent oxidoreductase, MSMEG_2516 family [Thermomonospora echinospora]